MIKIPGTPEGVNAIEQAIYEGINVNVTLLFAVEAYESVAEAYLRGLERRQAEGLPLDVDSVARFFVSRVDTNVDREARGAGRSDLAGTAALANARAAYRRFKEIFSGPRWEGLRHAGAAVQRPLWASTGTKNPALLRTPCTSTGWSARTPSTRCRWRRCTRFADHGNVSGPTAEHDPTDDLAALARGRHRHEPGDRRAAGRRRQAVRGRDDPSAGRDRRAPGRGGDRPPRDDRRDGSPTSCRRRSASASSGPCATTSPSGCGVATLAVGRPRSRRDRGSARLADACRTRCSSTRRRSRSSRSSAERTASPTRCCSGWAARRSGPR